MWRKVTNSPPGHWRVRCKLNVLPHPQGLGIRFSIQPYLKDMVIYEYHSFLNGRVVSQGDTPVLTCEPFWFLSSEFTLFPMISRMFFLSIVIKRLYLLTVIVQFRIWFMSSKLISNAVADVMLKF